MPTPFETSPRRTPANALPTAIAVVIVVAAAAAAASVAATVATVLVADVVVVGTAETVFAACRSFDLRSTVLVVR